MPKLEHLNSDQVALMATVGDAWMDRIFGCKTKLDKKAAIDLIKWLYKSANLEEPSILFVASPLGCQYAHNMLRMLTNKKKANVRDNVWANVGDNVWDNVWDNVRANVGANVWANVGDNVGANVRANVRDNVGANVRDNVWDNVWDNVRANVWANVGDNVWDNVWDNVRANVWDNVRANVGANVWANVGDNKMIWENFANYGNIGDYGWVAFYDFFERIGIFQHEGFAKFRSLLASGIYDMIQLKGLCIVCELPNKISRNERGRLHSESESAISWSDGYELFFWNGIAVSEKLIKTPELITRDDILVEKNAEKRRVIMEKLGSERYSELLELEEIDCDVDGCGNIQTLYRTKEVDEIAEEHLYFAKVTCPSTGRQYYLCTPPMKNIWDAVAYTFGKTKESYRPLIET